MRRIALVTNLLLLLGASCERSPSAAEEGEQTSGTKAAKPVLGAPFDDVVLLEAGLDETCVVVDSGATYCAGGDRGGYDREISLARPIAGAEHTTQISIGASACAVQQGGEVLCWGKARNEVLPASRAGEFGPAVIPGLPPVSHVLASSAAFPYWAFAAEDGSGWQWGGTTFASSFVAPAKEEGFALQGLVQVESNNNFYCARLRAGGVTCWDQQGYVNDALALSVKPLPPERPSNAVDLAVSYSSLEDPQYACVLEEDGQASCWRYLGKLLRETEPYPHPFVGERRWRDIALGAEHGCGVDRGGAVWCVGRNRYGQLGVAEPEQTSALIQVPGVTKATAVAVGYDHSCALLADRSVTCWGHNLDGQLGAPGRADRVAPTPFLRFTGTVADP